MPKKSKYLEEEYKRLKFYVEDIGDFKAVNFGLMQIKLINDQRLEHFDWKPYPTNVNLTGTKYLDLLLGIPVSESLFELPTKDFEE